MTTVDSPSDTRPDPLGVLVRDLQQQRLDAGAVSYGEIAQRIVARRMSEGASEAASRVARSTVYDAFQPGRRRLNPGLVREIVLALGLDAAQADEWHERCVLTRQPAPSPTVAPAAPAPDVHPADAATPPAPLVPPQALRRALIAVLLVACLGLNLFGTTLVLRLEIPLFLDTIGAALAAFALGPWYGVAVGVATGLFGMVSSTPETVVFSAVSVVAALLWGYGLRRYARTPLRFFALAVTVAVACSVVAAPLNLALYGGASTNASSAFLPVTTSLGLIASVFTVNLGASLVDKVLTAVLALVAARWLAPLQLTGPPPALLRTPTPGGRVSA
ncbi:hypothetical protein [Microbacterium aurantiacum]|uniref:hypothetical protein n=1 Tax=Microbacterium aurantiacum TaxID=162393 RepID=UPI0040361FA2